LKGITLKAVHNEVSLATWLLHAEIVDADYILVRQAARRLSLFLEPSKRGLIVVQVLQQELYGDDTIHILVASLVNNAHAAAAEHGEDLILLRKDTADKAIRLFGLASALRTFLRSAGKCHSAVFAEPMG
jgi:hypothetical protein